MAYRDIDAIVMALSTLIARGGTEAANNGRFTASPSFRGPWVVEPGVSERHTVTVDGERVVAVAHHPDIAREPETWLLFAHGLVSDKTGSYEGRCVRAATEGYHAVRFDHRGCGESDRSFGETTVETRLADLGAVLERFDPPRCVLFGSSFGGKVALHTALEWPSVAAVATRAPVTDVGALDGYEGLADEKFVAALERHPFERVVAELAVPLFVAHGRADEVVPVEGSLEAARALDVDVACRLFAGEGHSFSRSAETRLRGALFDWLERTLSFEKTRP